MQGPVFGSLSVLYGTTLRRHIVSFLPYERALSLAPPWIAWKNIDKGLYLSSLPHGGPCLWFSTWTAWNNIAEGPYSLLYSTWRALSLVPALDRMEYILLRGPIL
jgi:hypothetical protein